MQRHEKLLITLCLAFAVLPIAGILVYVILEPQDSSRPATWFLGLLLVTMFLWDEIAKKTYRPAIERWLEGCSRYCHLCADEVERMLPFGLFLIGLFVVDETATARFGVGVFMSSVLLLAFLVAMSAVWAAGRLFLERRRARKKNI